MSSSLKIAVALFSSVFFFSIAEPGSKPDSSSDASGRVTIKVILVAEDLSLRPVPKKALAIRSLVDPERTYSITTSFSGEASIELPAGVYRILTEEPLQFANSSFSWDVQFSVESKDESILELSNDNAMIEQTQRPAANVPMSEGELYKRLKDGVFKVISESGHGSGFLVSSAGFVLTNHHVVGQSDYLAVKLDEARKYPAVLVAEDAQNDVAVLRVNPKVIEGRPVLKLADDEPHAPPVSVGERVLAIGSPLDTETILTAGIVSKIEEDAIYSDVSINPGNSGGPLLNSLGEVVGINTFGDPTPYAHLGSGVAGIVRIHVASALLADVQKQVADLRLPEADRMPTASTFRFPPDVLKDQALNREFRPRDYHLEAGKFDVQFVDPFVIAVHEVKAEREAAAYREKRTKKKAKKTKRESKQYVPGEDFYEWRKYVGDYEPVVRIQAVPEWEMTGGSVFAVVMLGANAPKRYRFKTDFDRMELVRDGTVVEPIQPGRVPMMVNQEVGLDQFKDITYYGAYEYPPEAFRPGAELVLRIWHQAKPKPVEKPIRTELVTLIWETFGSYFEAMQEAVGEGKRAGGS